MRNEFTVCLLNWARPANVTRFCRLYLAMSSVAQVIVCNCNNQPIELADNRLLQITCTDDPGLPARFAAASLARTDTVLMVDDDIELTEATVNELRNIYSRRDPDSLTGIFGRNVSIEKGQQTYKPLTEHGHCDIVLTRAVMTHRRVCARALPAVTTMALDLKGEPFGNGEDIVLSYTARKTTGQKNFAVDLPFKNVGYDDRHAISVRFKQHQEHRTRVLRWCASNI